MAQFANPNSDVSNTGGWSPSSGSDLFAMINAANDSTYVEVTGDGSYSAQTFEVGLQSVTDPESSSGHKVVLRAGDSGGSGMIQVQYVLKQGSTAIKSSSVSLNPGTDDYETTLSSSEADSITDYSALRISVGSTDMTGFGETTTVFRAYLEVPDAPAPPAGGGRASVARSAAFSPAASPANNPTEKTL